MATGTNAWIEDELAGCHFADERVGRRLSTLLDQMAGAMGDSIPLACQDWANTKAAYRFFANERVSDADILAGHFDSTRQRVAATSGPLLVIQDTTEFSFQREHPEKICQTVRVNSGQDEEGRFRMHTVCGLLMHASLAVTTEGVPLGLGAVKFWTRTKFKGTAALKRKINPTWVPIEQKESVRWLENLRRTSLRLLGVEAQRLTDDASPARPLALHGGPFVVSAAPLLRCSAAPPSARSRRWSGCGGRVAWAPSRRCR